MVFCSLQWQPLSLFAINRVLWCSIRFTKKKKNTSTRVLSTSNTPNHRMYRGKDRHTPTTSRTSTDPRIRSKTPKNWYLGLVLRFRPRTRSLSPGGAGGLQSSRKHYWGLESTYLTTGYNSVLESSGYASLVPQAQRSGPGSGKGRRREWAVMVWTGLSYVGSNWVVSDGAMISKGN